MHFQFSKINAYHMEFSISWSCRKIIKIAILSSHYILRPVFIRCALMQKIAKIAANSPGLYLVPTFYRLVPKYSLYYFTMSPHYALVKQFSPTLAVKVRKDSISTAILVHLKSLAAAVRMALLCCTKKSLFPYYDTMGPNSL